MKTATEVKQDVLAELAWEPSLEASQIHVEFRDGVVTLTGRVPVYSEKHVAEEVVKRIHGVKAIANDIEVITSAHHHREDPRIAAAAVHALEWDAKVPHEQVRVVVADGYVTLEGRVEWQYEKVAAERVVRHLHGIRGITNAIVVQPIDEAADESALDLLNGVEAALARSAILKSRNVAVEIQAGGTVTLTGDVHSHREREEAERTAWSARGVTAVDNCITVTPWGFGPAEEWGY